MPNDVVEKPITQSDVGTRLGAQDAQSTSGDLGTMGISVAPRASQTSVDQAVVAKVEGVRWVWLKLQGFATTFGPAVVSKSALIVGLMIFGLVVFFLVKPFDSPRELPDDNAAVAWNAAIERLGIQPLYPPQEDFFVGDIYVTLDDPESEIAGEIIRYPSNVTSTSSQ
ncbi:hypothetical protein [Mesorhizobium sp. WSM2239]|uniref:Uncharacterized protein n=2 Tax=unclassified Mesorhizobium TaxID=325217 RepID=A0AAU8DD57_9HYPH